MALAGALRPDKSWLTPQNFAWQARGSIFTFVAALCLAGVALGNIHLHFCVAGVALGCNSQLRRVSSKRHWSTGEKIKCAHTVFHFPVYDTFCSYPPPLSFFLPVSAAKFGAPFWKKSTYWVIGSAIFNSVSRFLVLSLLRLIHYLLYNFCHTPPFT